MKKKLLLEAFLVVALMSGCISVNSAEEEAEHEAAAAMASCPVMTVYYPDGGGGTLPVSRTIPFEEHMEEAVLSRLSAPPDGFTAPVPEGTGFSVTRSEGTAVVDVTSLGALASREAEQAAVDCIVNTALAFPGVDRVELVFDGEKLVQLKNGVKVGEPFLDAPQSGE